MTDLLTLARDVMALPGFNADRIPLWVDPDGGRWSPMARTAYSVPDLLDDGVGGVLLGMLDCDVTIGRHRHGDRWLFILHAEGHEVVGSTLAEAVARVAVARGRWA